jgi:hypothetical protein
VKKKFDQRGRGRGRGRRRGELGPLSDLLGEFISDDDIVFYNFIHSHQLKEGRTPSQEIIAVRPSGEE